MLSKGAHPLLGDALEPGSPVPGRSPIRRAGATAVLGLGAAAALLFTVGAFLPSGPHSAPPSSLSQTWASQRPGLQRRATPAPARAIYYTGAEAQTLEAPATPVKEDSKQLWQEADETRVAEWSARHCINEASKLKTSDFPIKPEDLIMKAKIFLAYDMGVSKPDLLAEHFEFVGPVVGPLPKETYLRAVGGFKLGEAFPDMNNEMHHFRVDPCDTSRVWFTSRGRGTNTGDAPENPLFGKATGKEYVNPPQACSVRFDPDGKVNQYTIGAVMDRRIGNTGGLGGVYGIAYAMGKPLPFREAQPWKPSFRYRLFQKLGTLLRKVSDKK